MWNLEYELIAILLLAAIIGLIMGRFLCKSAESEEKIKKDKIAYAFKSAQSDLKEQLGIIETQQESIKTKERNISELEQKNSNLIARLSSSDEESHKLLEELKTLEKYKARFEALSREFDVQENLVETLKAQKGSTLEEIEQFKVQTNTLNQNMENLEKERAELTNHKEKQELLLDELLTVNKNQEKRIDELHILRDENSISLEQGTQYQAKLEQRVEELTKAFELKSSEYLQMEEEYGSYKASFNEAKQLELEETKERLYSEREDLLGRLRAISSVVGAVGVEEE